MVSNHKPCIHCRYGFNNPLCLYMRKVYIVFHFVYFILLLYLVSSLAIPVIQPCFLLLLNLELL